MRLKILALGSFALLLMGVSGNLPQASATPSAIEVTPQVGDYLEDEFIQALQTAHSPYKAISQGHVPQSIKLLQVNDGIQFNANVNWHEGYAAFTLRANGRMERGDPQVDYPKPKIDSIHHFRFREPGPNTLWHGYSFVGDADAEIAKIVLVGKYVDTKGQSYEFGADGILRGMGADTPFVLDNDHVVGNHFDYFILGREKPSFIAFKRSRSDLRLYPIVPLVTEDDSVGEPDFKHPLFVLHQVNE